MLPRIGEEKASSLGELGIDERKLRTDWAEIRAHAGSLAGLADCWADTEILALCEQLTQLKTGNRRIRPADPLKARPKPRYRPRASRPELQRQREKFGDTSAALRFRAWLRDETRGR
jgi:hypothetical protein